MLRSVFSKIFWLILISNVSFAQTDTTTNTTKPVPKIFFVDDRLFNGIRVGVDVAGIAYGFMSNDENFKLTNAFEINGDFGIKKYFITLDLGSKTFERKFADTVPSNSDYKSSGQYFRIGGDYRISKSAKSFLFVGGRLGKSFFKEEATLQFPALGVDQKIARPAAEYLINRKLSATWAELTTGMKVYMWKNLYLGYTFRFKLLLPSKKIKEEPPMDIPGFGVANKNNTLGFSFHIMYRIPFGDDPEVPMKGR